MPPLLRIAAVNHQDGGLDPLSGGGVGLDRLDAQLTVLAALDLDVLLSTEGKGWLDDEEKVLDHAAGRLGMLPLVARAFKTGQHAVIWLRPGRFRDIEEHHRSHPSFWHTQARAAVRLDGLDAPLWLVAAHFAPFDPVTRAAEAYNTLDAAADGRLTIIGGDLQDDPSVEEAPDRSHMDPARRLRYGIPGDPHAPAGLFRAAGMVDVAAALGNRDPTAGFVDGAPLRCDRVHLSRRLAQTQRSYRVHPDPHGTLSDHLIIEAELDLTSTM